MCFGGWVDGYVYVEGGGGIGGYICATRVGGGRKSVDGCRG